MRGPHITMPADSIDKQVAFLTEIDRLKSVDRATTLADGTRRENSAEHSWHVALYALVLADQARPDVDISRVIKMLLIHDLVEIDVGDVPIFGQYDADKLATEEATAARRILVYCRPIKRATSWIYGKNLRPQRPRMRNSPSRWIAFNPPTRTLPLAVAVGKNTASILSG